MCLRFDVRFVSLVKLIRSMNVKINLRESCEYNLNMRHTILLKNKMEKSGQLMQKDHQKKKNIQYYLGVCEYVERKKATLTQHLETTIRIIRIFNVMN